MCVVRPDGVASMHIYAGIHTEPPPSRAVCAASLAGDDARKSLGTGQNVSESQERLSRGLCDLKKFCAAEDKRFPVAVYV
jgi:hypothetical protein